METIFLSETSVVSMVQWQLGNIRCDTDATAVAETCIFWNNNICLALTLGNDSSAIQSTTSPLCWFRLLLLHYRNHMAMWFLAKRARPTEQGLLGFMRVSSSRQAAVVAAHRALGTKPLLTLVWVAVEELKLNCHNSETILFTMYSYYGN